MKSAVIYYSYSGNTKKVGDLLAEALKEKGEVAVVELKAQDESDNFFTQAIRALKHKKARVEATNLDLTGYDLVCLGTPVWAFGPAPAMNTFLEQCYGVKDKEVCLFATYGSGAGKERCLDYMQDILIKKGAKNFNRILIQQGKAKDREFVFAKIKEIMRLWPNG